MHVCAQWSVATARRGARGLETGISVIPVGLLVGCRRWRRARHGRRDQRRHFTLGIGSGAIGNPAFSGRWAWTPGAADRHDARVAGHVARPAGRRDGGAPRRRPSHCAASSLGIKPPKVPGGAGRARPADAARWPARRPTARHSTGAPPSRSPASREIVAEGAQQRGRDPGRRRR